MSRNLHLVDVTPDQLHSRHPARLAAAAIALAAVSLLIMAAPVDEEARGAQTTAMAAAEER